MTLKPNTIYWTAYPYVEGAELHEGMPENPSTYKHVILRTDESGEIIRFRQEGETFKYS